MRAKKVYEAIGNILKPKSKEEMKKISADWVNMNTFKTQIPRKTKDGHEVVLVLQIPKWYSDKIGKILVWGFVFVEEDGVWEWKAPEWNLDGTLLREYPWSKGLDLSINPITPEELEELSSSEIKESLDIFKPKSEDDILTDLAKLRISDYIDRKEGYQSSFKGKKHKADPLVLKIYYKALEEGLPVKISRDFSAYDDGRFKITIKDAEGWDHHLTFYQKDKWFISGKGDVKMDWLHCMDAHGSSVGGCEGPNQIRNFDDFLEVIEKTQDIGKEWVEMKKKVRWGPGANPDFFAGPPHPRQK